MNKRLLYLILFFSLLFYGCPQTDDDTIVKPKKDYYQKIELINETQEDVYGLLLLTNYSNSNTEIPFITVDNSTKYSRSISTSSNRSENIIKNRLDMPKPSYSRKMTSRNSSRAVTNYKEYKVGDTHPFWLIYSSDQNNYQRSFNLQSRETLESDIELFIWVDEKEANYSSLAISHLNTTFKKIYLEMTGIYGSHWGSHNGTRGGEELIPQENKDIHILLTDIDDDKNSSPQGLVNGYFHGYKDSFVQSDHPFNNSNVSNQSNNIVIDSYQYFHRTLEEELPKDWKENSYETAATITTVIHEFQHMLHFYNKDVKYDIYSDIFINEMFSMVAEDIFSYQYSLFYNENLKANSILSPDLIRIPEFNFFWDMQSYFKWDYSSLNLNSYSMSYVIGAYLIRNYGLELFLNYFETKQSGKDGLLYSLNQIDPTGEHNTQSLLKRMGTAILLSNNQISDKGLMFNKNEDFKINGYSLKPINFFDKNYTYYSLGTEQNRLYNYNYIKGYYHAPLSFVTTEDLARLNDTAEKEFLKESNIYVNLGKINKGAKIVIYTFAPNIDYQELYFTINE